MSLRSEYGKHYDNGDGTYTSYIDSAPLHYYEDGEWIDIDNTLVQDENGNYTNKSNSMKVTLSSETSVESVSEKTNDNQMVSINYDGYSLSWSFVDKSISCNQIAIEDASMVMSESDENIREEKILSDTSYEKNYPVSLLSINEQEYVEKEINNQKLSDKISESISNLNTSVTYNSLYDSVDCRVDIQPNSVKETLIIENADSIMKEYSYFIKADGLVAELYEDNSVIFSTDDGKSIFTIPAPFMFDSSENAENNYDISVSIEEYNDGYIYTLSPDIDWITDEARTYPVMIDPYVLPDNTASIVCRYNSQANPNNIYYGIKIGGETNNAYETYISIQNDYFNNYPTNICITEAKFYMKLKATTSVFTNNFDLYGVDSNVPYIFYNDINKGKAEYCKYIKTLNKTSSTSYDFGWSIDITDLANSWFNFANCGNASKGISQHGFKLVAKNGNKTFQGYDINDSIQSNRPYFWFTYEYSNDYYLPYVPERYNNIFDNVNTSSISIQNFQDKMNCYAYALQAYYIGTDGYYDLYPGEIGIGVNINNEYNTLNFGNLRDYYTEFENEVKDTIRLILNNNNIYSSQIQDYVGNNENFYDKINRYMLFVENQMRKDAVVMNFNISKYLNKDVIDYDHSKEFILPDDFDESSSRIIAMIAYYNYKDLYNGNLSMHYYMRNGSGTCPVHGGDCSIWSNKMGKGIVKNYPGENSNKILCDKTIYNYAYDLDNAFNGYNKDLIYFFNITKDNDLYSSKFENGHSTNSTGTLYYH